MDRLAVLFQDGYVLADTPDRRRVPGRKQEETCTEIALDQAMTFGTVRYKNRSLTLWPDGAMREAKEACEEMGTVVAAARERVDAEMPAAGLVCSFGAFDLQSWARIERARQNAARAAATAADDAMSAQMRRAVRLAQAHPRVSAVHDTAQALCTLAQRLCAEHGVQPPPKDGIEDTPVDNRRMWGEALACGHCPGELPHLVYWYISILDNTGDVERGLGQLLRSAEAHAGTGHIVQNDIFWVFQHGPSSEEELLSSQRGSGVSLPPGGERGDAKLDQLLRMEDTSMRCSSPCLTPFTMACAREWLRQFGRRFGRSGGPRPRKHAMSDMGVVRRQAAALDRRFKIGKGSEDGNVVSLFGAPVASLKRRVPDTERDEGQALKKFRALTRRKEDANARQLLLRRLGRNPYPVGQRRRGNMFTAPADAPAVPIAPAVSVRRTVRCCNISGAAIPGRPAHRIYMPPLSTDRLVGAHLIIVQAVSMADTMPADGAFVHAMLAAVALGKAVIAVKDWEGCSDPLRSPHCVRHEAACESVPTSLAITSSFSKKHSMTRQLLTKCSEAENSQWTVTILEDGGTTPGGAVLIHTQMDVYALVRRVRRIFRSAAGPQISGTLFPSGKSVPRGTAAIAPKSGGAAGHCGTGLGRLFG